MSQEPLIHPISSQKNIRTTEKFLFVFTPKRVAFDACCGCSLRTGVQLIAFLFVISRMANFMETLRQHGSKTELTVAFLALALDLIGSISLIYSTATLDYQYALIGYVIYAILFIVGVIVTIMNAVLIFFHLLSPLHAFSHLLSGLIYLVAATVVLLIQLYLIWIVYSYTVNLKRGKIGLVVGDSSARVEHISEFQKNEQWKTNPV